MITWLSNARFRWRTGRSAARGRSTPTPAPALKLVRPELIALDPTALERFKDEVRLARRISHRNVARTHDFGEAEGVYYVTMEFVAGTSLKELIRTRARLPVSATVSVGKQLCRVWRRPTSRGSSTATSSRRTSWWRRTAYGLVKVMDFGIARPVERDRGRTKTGLVIGTPDYMAPEQLLGEPLDARADLYAVGVVLYECLTGRRPHDADSPMALVGLKLSQDPVPPHEVAPGVPVALSRVVVRVLARDREARPPSAAALHEELAHAGDSAGA